MSDVSDEALHAWMSGETPSIPPFAARATAAYQAELAARNEEQAETREGLIHHLHTFLVDCLGMLPAEVAEAKLNYPGTMQESEVVVAEFDGFQFRVRYVTKKVMTKQSSEFGTETIMDISPIFEFKKFGSADWKQVASIEAVGRLLSK